MQDPQSMTHTEVAIRHPRNSCHLRFQPDLPQLCRVRPPLHLRCNRRLYSDPLQQQITQTLDKFTGGQELSEIVQALGRLMEGHEQTVAQIDMG